jgi:uncharacterized linocin/CFP29 family protein
MADVHDLRSSGSIADILLENGFDYNALRPFKAEDGKSYINKGTGVSRARNTATLRKDEWIKLDEAVNRVRRERLNLVADLESLGLSYTLPNAMGHTVFQYQNVSDITPAQISMDGINKSASDRAVYDLNSMPIPIVSKDLYFSAREIATSRNMGATIDVTTLEEAVRQVSEKIERIHVGTAGDYNFGGGNLYGLRNFPKRRTTTVSDWTDGSKTNEQRFNDLLGLIDLQRGQNHYGPYGVYVASNLERYLDEDFKANSDITLRERFLKVGRDSGNDTPGKIRFVKALDFLTAGDIIVVELASSVIQTIKGMGVTLVQWSGQGGLEYNFKVMAIQLPRCRADYNDQCGIVHATQAPVASAS